MKCTNSFPALPHLKWRGDFFMHLAYFTSVHKIGMMNTFELVYLSFLRCLEWSKGQVLLARCPRCL